MGLQALFGDVQNLRSQKWRVEEKQGQGLGPRGQLQAADKGRSQPQQELGKQSRAQTGVRQRDQKKLGVESKGEGVLQTAFTHPHCNPPHPPRLACCPDL